MHPAWLRCENLKYAHIPAFSLGGFPIVIPQLSAEMIVALNRLVGKSDNLSRHNQAIVEALMVSLRMMVGHKFTDRMAQRRLAEENYPTEAFRFERAHKSFGVGVQIRRPRQ